TRSVSEGPQAVGGEATPTAPAPKKIAMVLSTIVRDRVTAVRGIASLATDSLANASGSYVLSLRLQTTSWDLDDSRPATVQTPAGVPHGNHAARRRTLRMHLRRIPPHSRQLAL